MDELCWPHNSAVVNPAVVNPASVGSRIAIILFVAGLRALRASSAL